MRKSSSDGSPGPSDGGFRALGEVPMAKGPMGKVPKTKTNKIPKTNTAPKTKIRTEFPESWLWFDESIK